MFSVTLGNGRQIRVSFMHSSPLSRDPDIDGMSPARLALEAMARANQRRLSQCRVAEIITSGPDGHNDVFPQLLSEGYFINHPKKEFSKAIARKAGFTNALIGGEFTLVERRELWQEFLRQEGIVTRVHIPSRTEKITWPVTIEGAVTV